MKTNFTLLALLIFTLSLTAQRYDYQWPMGYGSNFALDFGISMLDFNDQDVNVYPFAEIDDFELGEGGSFICDENGHVMLMTNNCKVVDANFQTILNGDTLTPGYTHDHYCPAGAFPSTQSTLFLPEFSNDSTIYLVHNDAFVSGVFQDVISEAFYISIIIRRPNGTFYLKEKRLFRETTMIASRVTAGLHADGDKWWTWVHDYGSNRFHKFLVGADTIQGPFSQDIGPEATTFNFDVGQTAFSPDMTMLAINTDTWGILLFDFDNATGELSNYRIISYPNLPDAKGLVFSPDSRFIYASTADNLYQIDLQASSSEEQVVHIAYVWEPDETGWPIGIGEMYIGPDCRIYIAPATTTYYVHVIHRPNEKGTACQFQKRAIRMPTNLLFRFPNLPMYRFNGACDPNIAWSFPTATEDHEPIAALLRVFPNPAQSEVVVEFPEGFEAANIILADLAGRRCGSYPAAKGVQQVRINVSALPAGLYFVQPEGQRQVVKLVIAR